MLVLATLLACTGGDKPDTGGGEDTADTATPPVDGEPLSDAHARVLGATSDAAGAAVATAPDVLVVAAPFGGRTCTFPVPVAPGVRALDDGACLLAEADRDYPGFSVALGDVDGDGASDLLLGAVGSDEAGADAGKAYLVRGPIVGGSVAGEAHASWLGEASLDYAGSSVALLDVDGDGDDDVLVGAQGNGAGGVTGGRAYLFRSPVVAGPGALASAAATITGLGPDTVAPPHGAPSVGDGLGSVVANAGDVDGDGLEDLLLGANGADDGGVDGGSAGLFFGPLADGDRAFRDADRFWYGVGDGLYVGDSVAGAGDLDGDGYADVMIGGDAPVSGAPGPGVVWLLHGPGVVGAADIETAETRIVGEEPGDLAGAYTAAAGDTDGDGAADLLVGAYGVDLDDYNEGAAYLVHGPFAPGAVALADVRPRWVGTVDGAAAGSAVAGGADLDGDALPDLLIGARYDTTGGSYAGQAYVVLP